MKVKITSSSLDITKEKLYDIQENDAGMILVIDDRGDRQWFEVGEYELIKEVSEMKELTFKEVIANIKEGEVWESSEKIIKQIDGQIFVTRKDKTPFNGGAIVFNNDRKYKLARQEYSFQEAFEAFENGKKIESCCNNYCYKRVGELIHITINNDPLYDYKNVGFVFSAEQIKNKWYIYK